MTSSGRTSAILSRLLTIGVFVLAMSFCDSFHTELFSKLQSLYTAEFLIDGRGMSQAEALGHLSVVNLPFLIIGWLTPLGRLLIDVLGRNRAYLMNLGCMLLGAALCFHSPNLIVFLIGSAVLTFSCSLDIQNIFLVDETPENRRATVRGIAGGASALASMLLPFVRSLCINRLRTWRVVYLTAALLCLLLLLVSVLLLPRASVASGEDPQTHPAAEPFSLRVFCSRRLLRIMLPLAVIGAATAGISFYNEPLLSYSGRSEASVDIILLIQPVALFCTSILCGILADRIGRRIVLIVCTALSGGCLILFCLTAGQTAFVLLPGLLWGLMYGCYYTVVNLLQLQMIELAPAHAVGRYSAAAVIVYGCGDAIGILLASFLVSPLDMTRTKLLTALPFLLIGALLLAYSSKRA